MRYTCMNCWWYLRIGKVHICLLDKTQINEDVIEIQKSENVDVSCDNWESE